MFGTLTKKVFPIGVDFGSSYLRMAQLGSNGAGLYLHGLNFERRPEEITPGSSDWQRWAARTLKRMIKRSGFKGKKVVTALPSRDVFIDQIRIPRMGEHRVADAVIGNVKHKLPFPAERAVIKHVVAGDAGAKTPEMDVLVMAADRITVDRHLAIYENAGLEVQSIDVWPFAMTNSFVEFFNRRRPERDKVAMLLDLGTNNTNIVICRGRDLKLARVVGLGCENLGQEEMVDRLMSEIDACSRYFEFHCGGTRVQRLVFLARQDVDKRICHKLAEMAQRMQIPAQIGDVLTAVNMARACESRVSRSDIRFDWSISFGLSLSGMNGKNGK